MGELKAACDLCGLSIDGPAVTQVFDGQQKQFCCQGCERVYAIAFENNMLDQVLVEPKKPRQSLKEAVLGVGETSYFAVSGMWCSGCAVAAEKALRNQPGIHSVDISFAAERGRMNYDPELVEPDEVLAQLNKLGYKANSLTDLSEREASRLQDRTFLQFITAAAFGMWITILYLVQLYPLYAQGDYSSPDVRHLEILTGVLATPVLVFGGSSFFIGAWQALKARTATMDTLVALGTLSAYVYSVYASLTGSGEAYFDSVGMITTFVMFGRYLETLGGAQARKDIGKLLKLQPEKAWIQEKEQWTQVKSAELLPGNTILIKPGERVPADAEILEGDAYLNESLLTGESMPVHKQVGDSIYAGTLVSDAALVARVTGGIRETRLAQITRLVEETLSVKPPIQRLADRASAYFAFGMIAIAGVTFAGWYLLGHSLARAMLSSISVLVVACPCALGLATPLAITVTLGRTTQAGILIRNLVSLETAAHINRLVFDKTGTLTYGRMVVTTIAANPDSGLNKDEVLQFAASVEQFSEHPIAQAIMAAFKASAGDRRLLEAGGFQSLRGLGVSAQVENGKRETVFVGSERFFDQPVDSPFYQQAENHKQRAETVVWIGSQGCAMGFISLSDEYNPTAGPAVKQLIEMGIQQVTLSGDSQTATRAVAEKVGIPEYAGGCTPDEKARRLRQWQANGEKVAMIGDGVNDAPALAQADLSIAMAGGADVAGQTSDVLLTRSDLTLAPWLIAQSARTRRTIFENLGWAFAYNIIAVPLAAFGIISPVIAAGAMATSSLLVVGNSLRLRK